jgi:uncharacterized protein YaeQ
MGLFVSRHGMDDNAKLLCRLCQKRQPTPPNPRSWLALGAVVHTFRVQLSHVDRGIYESLDLRVARHPSESEEFLWARVLAFCLEYREGLAFSKGLAEPDQPALEVRDLTGTMLVWIDVGAPDAARLHRASKAAGRVAVYTQRDAERYWTSLRGTRIHNAESLELYGFDHALVAALVARLERRLAFELSFSNGVLYLTLGQELLSGPVTAHRLAP